MIWFTSDTHFYHFNVIGYCDRPFRTVEEMNEIMAKKWNEVVAPEDTVYFLGDFSLAIRPVELYTNRLNGRKIMIMGNHDWCHPYNKKSKGEEKRRNVYKMYYDYGWKELHLFQTLAITETTTVNLCHMPYRGDVESDKYSAFRLEDDGKVLLCGHVHEKWATKRTPKGTLMINVGVDVRGFKPISIQEISTIIKESENGI